MSQGITLTQLRRRTGLPKRVTDFLLNSHVGPDRLNLYACYLDVLGQGYKALGNSYEYEGKQKFSVSETVINDVVTVLPRLKIAYIRRGERVEEFLLGYIKRTPGWKQMSSEQGYDTPPNDSKIGFLGFQLPMIPRTPASGPDSNVPPLSEQLLNKIHPKFTDGIENFCKLIRARAYLALPAMAFGSLQRVVGGLTGVVVAFQRVINSIYQGALRIIQQFYAYINGIISQIQRWIMWLIEQLIPIRLICLILEAIQVLLDDLNFFTSLFSQSAAIFGFLNQVQNFVNTASSLLSNPFATITSFLPPEVLQIIDLINQIGTDPNGFITDQLTNFGYAWAAEAIQGNIIAALVDRFGPQFRAIGPISSLINNFGVGAPVPYYPPDPASMFPSWNSGSNTDPIVDTNANPIDGFYRIINQTSSQVSGAVGDLGQSITNVGTVLKDEGKYITKIPSKVSGALGELFGS
jgi:hypothetical protein